MVRTVTCGLRARLWIVNVRETEWTLEGEERLTVELGREADRVLARVDDDPTAILDDVELPEADRAVLADPLVREQLRVSTLEMFAQGIWGWVDDDLAICAPWGFDVAELRVPVEIRYGKTDVLAPPGHSEWLATHIPHATVVADDEAGHMSTPDERLARLRELAFA